MLDTDYARAARESGGKIVMSYSEAPAADYKFSATCPECGAPRTKGAGKRSVYACGGRWERETLIEWHTGWYKIECPLVEVANAQG